MAWAVRLPCLSLPRRTGRGYGQGQQPMGLVLGLGPLTVRGRVRRVCVQCKAHAQQSAEVSASDGAKTSSTWTPRDPFASSSEPYAGWDALDAKSETDYWTGVLQIGAGLGLALGFSMVSHAYARRGGGAALEAAPPAAAGQGVLLAVDAGGAVEHDSLGFAGAGKERKQAEAVPDEPAAGQGSNEHAVAVGDAEVQEKLQHKAVPAAQVSPVTVVIPAVVDQVQEQALAVLQALKVIETGVEGGNVCTRREYARWLINASNILAKSSSRKVFPAMYIQNVTELAFDDVTPQDPDFPSIQGLAEAGLIASRLSQQDLEGEDDGGVYFAPDNPLSRQDLLSWKLALDGGLAKVDRQTLQAKSGFIDIDRIHEDAWPAVFADLSAGEDSIIATAFGYTRRFHPSKPTTIGQAAVALVLGEASALVADESARLQAEKIAEQAVRAEMEMEARVFQEVDAALKEMVELEREGKVQAQSLAETLQSQLEGLKLDREQEKYSVLREQALVDAEKGVIAEYRRELEQELQALAALRVELSFEKDRAGKSWVEVEQERDAVEKLKNEIEIEKQALILARRWAEQEARNARTHSKVLEEARKRWESQGIEVIVDEKLSEENIPEQTWTYAERSIDVESEQGAPDTVVAGDRNVVQQARDGVVDFVLDGRAKVLDLISRVMQVLRDILAKLRADASDRLSQLADATEKGRQGALSLASAKAQEMQQGATCAVTGVLTSVSQGTRKLASGLKQEAEKIAQKFNTT